jgi:hypothetical protein
MRALDGINAAVVAGELHDLVVIGLSCCYLIVAGSDGLYERLRSVLGLPDDERFRTNPDRVRNRAALVALLSEQLQTRTSVEWEAELTAATSELAASRPAMTADGLVRLAELRRRQGRLVEAAEMFDQAGSHSLALLGRAQLAFDRDDAAGAAELAARYMRRVGAERRTRRRARDAVTRAGHHG